MDGDNTASNATTINQNETFRCFASDQGVFELTYRFEKPILFRGYILKTANGNNECDPKDWTVDCRNIADNISTVISTVTDEGDRDRLVDKQYRVDSSVGDIWTDRISIKVTAT